MPEKLEQRSWLRAIGEAAREQGFQLPPFTGHGMGSARTMTVPNGRFVTFKRRLVAGDQAENEGVEWSLWQTQDELPSPVATFREPLHPNKENIAAVLPILKGWLIDEWPVDATKAAVGRHPRAQVVAEVVPPSDQ